MILNDEQCGRFFDTMDSLLCYVNERFQVVEGFSLDYDGQIGDMKTALVARALWENVEIIDEFVRDNPAHLPQRCLDTALAWKEALPGLYTAVRYQNGNAILMNDAGVFSAAGISLELEGEIGPAPAYVDLVLIPFDDIVIYDGFLQVYDGDGSVDEAVRIQDEFENRCAQGIVSTATDFAKVARAFLDDKRSAELDALLNGIAEEAASKDEELPAGYHRGVLAGLDPIEREQRIEEEWHRRQAEAIARWGQAGMHRADAQAGGEGEAGDAALFDEPYDQVDTQVEQAINCMIACAISRGLVEMGEAYAQYCALAPNPLPHNDFASVARQEAAYSDAFFGLWEFEGQEYLMYYTLTPDYLTQQASREGSWNTLRDDLEYYESFRRGLLQAREEVPPKPLSRTLIENTALGELLRDESVIRLRQFLDERIPDGQDDYSFADVAVQEFALTSIEAGSLEELNRLAEDLGITGCTADETRLPRLVTNVFNNMPSWENNGWSPQELYEQLTGRRMFYNEDGTVKKVGRDDPCPCGSGRKYRDCCGR